MRNIETQIQEKRRCPIFVNKLQCSLSNKIGKILPVFEYLGGAFIQVMIAFPVKEIMIEVIDKSVANSEEFIKSLFGRSIVTMRPNMPLSKQCGSVSC